PLSGLKDKLLLIGAAVGGMAAIGMVAAVLALLGLDAQWLGTILVVPFIAGAMSLNHRRPVVLRRKRLRPVRPRALLPAASEEHVGVGERWRETVDSPLTRSACLASTLVVRPTSGESVVYWHSVVADFWLVRDDGTRVLISGPIWIEGEA